MARVSLILPTTPQAPLLPEQVGPLQRGLEEAGHSVEVVVVLGPGGADLPDGLDSSWRQASTGKPGLAAAAVSGLREATGEVLLVVDPGMGYAPKDLARVAEPLTRGEADLAVASRFSAADGEAPAVRRGRLRTCAGALARPLTGTTDPLSGLIGLTRELFAEAADAMRPVGTKFAVELLARTGGRWVEVPVAVGRPRRRSRMEFDHLRQLKRLADHRHGH